MKERWGESSTKGWDLLLWVQVPLKRQAPQRVKSAKSAATEVLMASQPKVTNFGCNC